jgi:hypothetical protein
MPVLVEDAAEAVPSVYLEAVGCQKSAWPVSCSDDQVGCAA